MKIAVASLAAGRHTFESCAPVSEYGLWTAGTELSFCGSITVEATVHKMGEQLFAQVAARGAIRAECARCLEPLEAPVAATCTVLYVPAGRRDAEESRTDRAETESQRVHYYSGGVVDLGEPAVEALALAAPMKPLCRPDCRGLCPHCGKNRNEGECGCREQDDARRPFQGLFGE